MVLAFESLFSLGYEGGANWQEVSLLSLSLLPEPPRCLVLRASADSLPDAVRDAPFVEPRLVPRVQLSTARRAFESLARRVFRRSWENQTITEIAALDDVDLWIGFCGFEGLGSQRPLLVWWPDFQFHHFPELFPPEELDGRWGQWSYVVRRADGILVISEAVANDAMAVSPEVASKLHVCPFPPLVQADQLMQQPEQVRDRYRLPAKFFLVSNQFFKHKNHLLVLEALRILKEDGTEPPVVAFTGRLEDYRHPLAASELLQFVHVQGLHPYCRFLGVLRRDDQLALIRAAQAVIQPSRFEGRGAIAEEAALLGATLLCTDLPVHRELHLANVRMFSPNDARRLADLLRDSYPNSIKPAEQIADESRAQAIAYSQRFLAVCQETVNSSQRRRARR